MNFKKSLSVLFISLMAVSVLAIAGCQKKAEAPAETAPVEAVTETAPAADAAVSPAPDAEPTPASAQ